MQRYNNSSHYHDYQHTNATLLDRNTQGKRNSCSSHDFMITPMRQRKPVRGGSYSRDCVSRGFDYILPQIHKIIFVIFLRNMMLKMVLWDKTYKMWDSMPILLYNNMDIILRKCCFELFGSMYINNKSIIYKERKYIFL